MTDDSTTALLAAGGALAASETLGITNLFGGDGGVLSGRQFGRLISEIPEGSTGATIVPTAGSGETIERITGLTDVVGGDSAIGGARSVGRDRPLPAKQGDPREFELQDLAGEGKLGTTVATTAEAAEATGKSARSSRDFISSTVGDPGKVLRASETGGDPGGGLLGFSFEAGQVTGRAGRDIMGKAEPGGGGLRGMSFEAGRSTREAYETVQHGGLDAAEDIKEGVTSAPGDAKDFIGGFL